MKRDELLYVYDILESINLIKRFSKGLTKEEFIEDKLRQSAIIRQIEIIGEAAKNISKETRKKYSGIKWKKITGTRDVFTHAYFDVILDRVFDIIKNDISDLRVKILKIKKDLELKKKNNDL